jgi:concentrative nucleoside transporter, CNT family
MNLQWLLSPLMGMVFILGLAYVGSVNRRAIEWGLIIRAVVLQIMLAVLFTQVPQAQQAMAGIGEGIEQLQTFANKGGAFVFGGFISNPEALAKLFGPAGAFVFALKLLPVLVFVASLVAILYYLGILQIIVKLSARVVNAILGVSGIEALSNTASIFVGQVEAQLLVKPYLKNATTSELLAMMAGSFACISGGMMAVYIGMGVPASYLLTASIMAIPGGFAVSKLLQPETETPQTRGQVELENAHPAVNVIDAAAQGATEGWHIGVSVLAMLIAFISLVAFLDAGFGLLGTLLVKWGIPAQLGPLSLNALSLSSLMGIVFYPVALLMGIPAQDALSAASLLGSKMMINEFVAYSELVKLGQQGMIHPVTQAMLSVALCGFANLGSIAIQLGGIGAMVPERRGDIARLGVKAMLCGTLASYLSATIVGGIARFNLQATLPGWAIAVLLAVGAGVIVLTRRMPTPQSPQHPA